MTWLRLFPSAVTCTPSEVTAAGSTEFEAEGVSVLVLSDSSWEEGGGVYDMPCLARMADEWAFASSEVFGSGRGMLVLV